MDVFIFVVKCTRETVCALFRLLLLTVRRQVEALKRDRRYSPATLAVTISAEVKCTQQTHRSALNCLYTGGQT